MHEYIHPCVRYRMGLLEEKPKALGQVTGWMGGKTDIKEYKPVALKGFEITQVDGQCQAYNWNKPAIEGREEAVIREYRISLNQEGSWTNEGLERRIVPEKVMAELDLGNYYGGSVTLSA